LATVRFLGNTLSEGKKRNPKDELWFGMIGAKKQRREKRGNELRTVNAYEAGSTNLKDLEKTHSRQDL